MKKRKIVSALLCAGLLYSCSPKIRTNLAAGYQPKALDYDAEVFVYSVHEMVPKNLEKIAQVSLGDSGMTLTCNYETLLEKAKEEARKVGANVVKITEHKTPNFWTNCHRIKTSLYKGADIVALQQRKAGKAVENSLGDVDYALLNVYRYSGVGPIVNYNLKLGDSTLCRVKNNFKTTVKIKKEGLNSLVAKTEAKVELPFDVIFGKEYFFALLCRDGTSHGKASHGICSLSKWKSRI